MGKLESKIKNAGLKITLTNGLPATIRLLSNDKLKQIATLCKNPVTIFNNNMRITYQGITPERTGEHFVVTVELEGETIHLIYPSRISLDVLMDVLTVHLTENDKWVYLIIYNGRAYSVLSNTRGSTLIKSIIHKCKPSVYALLESEPKR